MAKTNNSAGNSKGEDGKLSKKSNSTPGAESNDLPSEGGNSGEGINPAVSESEAPEPSTSDPLAPLNLLVQSLEKMFTERAGTSLPGITETEVKKMAADSGVEVVFQFSNAENTKGRMILKYDGQMRDLPTDVNKEYDFGIDFEAMGEKQKSIGQEWTDVQEKKARAKYEADQADKNRQSIEKLSKIGKSLEESFEQRSQTNLPGLTEDDVLDFLKPHLNTIGVEFEHDERDPEKPRAAILLSEFNNKKRVPERGFLPFGVKF